MKSIVPIIGYELGVGSSQKKRIERLLSERGFVASWTDNGFITELLAYSPLRTSIPLTIDIYQADAWEEHSDIVMPILEKFSSTLLLLCKPASVAKQIYKLPPEISLWGKKAPQEHVRRAIEYIYSHLDDSEMAIDDICKAAYHAEDTLERKFEDWNSRSIWKHVEYMRLREGCRLLEETNAAISEIAISVGYIDHTSFDRAFKKEFGETPSAFRQNVKLLRENAT